MNARSLATLAAVVIVVIVAAVWVSTSRRESNGDEGTLYPTLKSRLNEIEAVRIYGPGNEHRVELVRADREWRVAERSQYPAATDKVQQLVLDLSEAKLVEEKTSKPANYAALGVQDVAANDAPGARVELVGAEGVDLILGKTGPGVNSRYVRRAGEQTSWLVDRALEAPTDPKRWLKQQIVDVAADRVHSVHIEIRGKQPYTASKSKPDDANFVVQNLKKDQALSSESAANGVGSALTSLNLEDVVPFTEWRDKPPQAKAAYTTFDGVKLALTGWTEGGTHRLHVRTSFDEQLARQFAPQPDEKSTEQDDSGKEKAESNTAPDRQAEANTLDTRLQAWVFAIPEYKYNAIFQPLDELLKQ